VTWPENQKFQFLWADPQAFPFTIPYELEYRVAIEYHTYQVGRNVVFVTESLAEAF
jgi:hypothetical protein